MATQYSALPPVDHDYSHLEIPARPTLPELVHLEDPASDIMIDFAEIPATRVKSGTSLDKAIEIIRQTTRYVLLVTNDESELIGIISAAYLLSSKPIQFISENRLSRDCVNINMLMTPVSEIIQLEASLLKHARIGNIVQTMIECQKNYAIVIEHQGEEKHLVKGIFALPVISKHMQNNVAVKPWVNEMATVATMQHEHIGKKK